MARVGQSQELGLYWIVDFCLFMHELRVQLPLCKSAVVHFLPLLFLPVSHRKPVPIICPDDRFAVSDQDQNMISIWFRKQIVDVKTVEVCGAR